MADYQVVDEPIPFPDAFHESGNVAAQSQAAVLLALGALLRYEEPRTYEALSIATAPAPQSLDILPEEEMETMRLPREMMSLLDVRGVRFDSYFVRQTLRDYDSSFSGSL